MRLDNTAAPTATLDWQKNGRVQKAAQTRLAIEQMISEISTRFLNLP